MAVDYNREKQELTRRNFLSLGGYVLGGIASLGALGFVGRFFWPNVAYGPPSKFNIGKASNYPDGAKQNIADQKVSIIRHANKIGAISMVCQHLGCTVAASATGYDCPCHGSKYDDMGNVTHGPAQIALYWFDISLTPSGDLEVDKSKKLLPGSYYTVQG
ncbi:MAG: Rieske 2Fe-2S domain-containing protein [Armatimonadetes bacterium]|nr:Rieske 2Fe-2S domain-containing protein [Armatimonadota bacterium]